MRPYRVLIVDDHHDSRRVFRAGLESMSVDLQITDVPSGEEAILVNSRQPFDLLIVDIRLPGISGLELIERSQFRNPKLKIILVTGMTDQFIREQIEKAGVFAYFYKPVEMEDFQNAVRECLQFEPAAEISKAIQADPPRSPALGIAERLAGLRNKLKAHCAVLISERGEFVAQAGNLPATMDADSLVQTALSTLNAIEKVSLLAGGAALNDLTMITGSQYDLALAHVGQPIGLLLVTSAGGFTAKEATKLASEIQDAVADLQAILTQIGVPIEMPESEPAPEQPDRLDEMTAEEADSDLEAVFGSLDRVAAVDADSFWESAVDGERVDEALRSSAISYEQARQLGLTPDES